MVRLMRPHQYTKNLLIFAAPGAAGRLDESGTFWRALLAFALFCAISSAGYVANDLGDVEMDRLHPRKRRRPIASGAVSERSARMLLAVLVVVPVLLAPTLGWLFTLTLLGYAALTFTYSATLKHVPWVELVVVSAGFLLRAVAGGAATETRLSSWFLLVVSAGALVVITGKRLGELLSLGPDTPSRPVLQNYAEMTLRVMSATAAALAVGAYAAWAGSDASSRTGDDTGDLFVRLTIVPFVIAILRYLALSWRGRGEAPDILVLRDPGMIAIGLGWVALYLIGLYR